MWCYRNNGCLGIKECFCIDCNNLFYVSSFGAYYNRDYDYMLDAYNKLIGQKQVKIIEKIIDPVTGNVGWNYEDANDYEKYDIIHRVKTESFKMRSEDKKDPIIRYTYYFEKGKNYGKYNIQNHYHCPYCNSDDIRFSHIGYDWKDILFGSDWYYDRHKDYAFTTLENTLSKYESEKILNFLPKQNININEKEYLRILLECYNNIYYYTERLRSLYFGYSMYFDIVYGEYVKDNDFPNKLFVKDEPLKNYQNKVGFLNRRKKIKENIENEKIYNDKLKSYEQSFKEYNKKLSEYIKDKNERVNNFQYLVDNRDFEKIKTIDFKNKDTFEIIIDEMDECEKYLEDFISFKKKLLSLNVVHSKYIDYPIIATLYGYFDTGRCSSLTGENGAYNKYESEYRQDLIITKLDEVIDSLEEIKNNQYLLYESINKMNNNLENMSTKMSNIISAVNSIESKTAKNEYYNSRIAYNTEISKNRLEIIEFLEMYNILRK